jgi:putative intracellular protease/amidase
MPSNSARGRRSAPGENLATRRVAMVVFPGVTLLDISGPAQVFAELREIDLPGASYSLSYLSSAGGSVPTDVGMTIGTAPISSVRPHQVDTLVIPGGPGIWALRQDVSLMNWISQAVLRARRVASVCVDRGAGWQARGNALALLSEIAGQLSRHPG